MGVFKDMGKTVLRYVSLSGEMKGLSKDDILEIIEINLETHKQINNIGNTFTRKELNQVFDNYRANVANINPKALPTKDFPFTFKSNIKSSARADETKEPFSVVLDINKVFIKTLNEIKKNIDEVVKNDHVNLFNSRLSHVAVLGLLKESEIFATVTVHLWNQIGAISSSPDNVVKIKEYRTKYIQEYQSAWIDIINLVLDKKGKYYFMHEISNLRNKELNVKVYSEDIAAHDIVHERDFTKSALNHFKFGYLFFNLFAWVGEVFSDWRHAKYERNVQLREWMESHNALLKMELGGADPESPEYVNKRKIIDHWDDEITKLDRKINKYLEED